MATDWESDLGLLSPKMVSFAKVTWLLEAKRLARSFDCIHPKVKPTRQTFLTPRKKHNIFQGQWPEAGDLGPKSKSDVVDN